MDSIKYIGLDVHQSTISVAVLDSNGKLAMQSVIATHAATILDFLHGLRGTLHVTFEEGTHSAWLYDLLVRRVAKLVPHSFASFANEWERVIPHQAVWRRERKAPYQLCWNLSRLQPNPHSSKGGLSGARIIKGRPFRSRVWLLCEAVTNLTKGTPDG